MTETAPLTRRALRMASLALALLAAACGSSSNAPNDPDAATTPDLSGARGCVGGGSCAGLNDIECTSASLFGLSCTRTTAAACQFGGLVIGTPSDPGCGAQESAVDCTGLSVGCRWDGATCSFKACHLQETEEACGGVGCVWEVDTCYFNDCPTLDEAACPGAHRCIWREDFAGCEGTYTCDQLDGEFAPGVSEEQLCDAAGQQAGLGCVWVP